MSDTASCAGCMYGKPALAHPGSLLCLRHPPSWSGHQGSAAHILVDGDDWCGEFVATGGGTPPVNGGGSGMGVTDGSEAAAGHIGEYVVASNSTGITLTSNVPLTICQLSLSAGDWEIWGTVDFRPAAGVSPNAITSSISVHPNALPTDTDLWTGVGVLNMFTTNSLTSGQRQVLMTGTCRSNSAAASVLYLVGQTTLGSQTSILTGRGYICARRVR